jgi:hypothetical protein
MDRWGDHAVPCRIGKEVAVTYRHNAVRAMKFRMAKELGLDVVGLTVLNVKELEGIFGKFLTLLSKEFEVTF